MTDQAATPPAAPAEATGSKAQLALDKWLADNIHNTALSQDTPKYNRVHALYRQLRDLVA